MLGRGSLSEIGRLTAWAETVGLLLDADDEGRITDDVMGVKDLLDAKELDRSLAWAWKNWPFWGDGEGPSPRGWVNPWLNGDFEVLSSLAEPYEKEAVL
jgi:hypothetical protein